MMLVLFFGLVSIDSSTVGDLASCPEVKCGGMMDCLLGGRCDEFINSSYGLDRVSPPPTEMTSYIVQIHFAGITEAQMISDPKKQDACKKGIAAVLGLPLTVIKIIKIGNQAIGRRRLGDSDLIVEFEIRTEDPGIVSKVEAIAVSDFQSQIQAEVAKLGITDFDVQITQEPTTKVVIRSDPPTTESSSNSTATIVIIVASVGMLGIVGVIWHKSGKDAAGGSLSSKDEDAPTRKASQFVQANPMKQNMDTDSGTLKRVQSKVIA
jgi:hypothetical protein